MPLLSYVEPSCAHRLRLCSWPLPTIEEPTRDLLGAAMNVQSCDQLFPVRPRPRERELVVRFDDRRGGHSSSFKKHERSCARHVWRRRDNASSALEASPKSAMYVLAWLAESLEGTDSNRPITRVDCSSPLFNSRPMEGSGRSFFERERGEVGIVFDGFRGECPGPATEPGAWIG